MTTEPILLESNRGPIVLSDVAAIIKVESSDTPITIPREKASAQIEVFEPLRVRIRSGNRSEDFHLSGEDVERLWTWLDKSVDLIDDDEKWVPSRQESVSAGSARDVAFFFLIGEAICISVILFSPWTLFRLIGIAGCIGVAGTTIGIVFSRVQKNKATKDFENQNFDMLLSTRPRLVKLDDSSMSDTLYGAKTEAWFEALLLAAGQNAPVDLNRIHPLLQREWVRLLELLRDFVDSHWTFKNSSEKEPVILSGPTSTDLRITLNWLRKLANYHDTVFRARLAPNQHPIWNSAVLWCRVSKRSRTIVRTLSTPTSLATEISRLSSAPDRKM